MNKARIAPYDPRYEKSLLELSRRSWKPVFDGFEPNIPDVAYASYYPKGCQVRQPTDLRAVLRDEQHNVSVAIIDEIVVGWVCVRIHPEDQMGEIYVLAVDPMFQRRGIGSKLVNHAFDVIRSAGMKMAMVRRATTPAMRLPGTRTNPRASNAGRSLGTSRASYRRAARNGAHTKVESLADTTRGLRACGCAGPGRGAKPESGRSRR